MVQEIKHKNFFNWVNIKTTGDSYGFNDLIADLGGQWGPVDDPNVNNYSSSASHGDVSGLISSLSASGQAIVHTCEQ